MYYQKKKKERKKLLAMSNIKWLSVLVLNITPSVPKYKITLSNLEKLRKIFKFMEA